MMTIRKTAALGVLLIATLGSFGAIASAEDGTSANAPASSGIDQSQASAPVNDGSQLATNNTQAADHKCGSPGKDGQDGADGATGKGGKGGKGGAAGNCAN